MLTHVNVYVITFNLCIYQISCPQTNKAILGINCGGHFTGILIDFSSSTSTLEIYMQISTITKVHVISLDRVLQCVFFSAERCTGFFCVAYFISQDS